MRKGNKSQYYEILKYIKTILHRTVIVSFYPFQVCGGSTILHILDFQVTAFFAHLPLSFFFISFLYPPFEKYKSEVQTRTRKQPTSSMLANRYLRLVKLKNNLLA